MMARRFIAGYIRNFTGFWKPKEETKVQVGDPDEPRQKRARLDNVLTGDYSQEGDNKENWAWNATRDERTANFQQLRSRLRRNFQSEQDVRTGQSKDGSGSSIASTQSGSTETTPTKQHPQDMQEEPVRRTRNRRSRRTQRASSTRDVNPVIKYNVTNYFLNSPFTIGSSVGNQFIYDLPTKLYLIKEGKKDYEGTKELQNKIKRMIKENQPGVTSLKDICRECDAETIGVGDGCVKLTLRFRSLEGLQRYRGMYSTGELERRLKTDLPIEKVQISESDYKKGCVFFEEAEKIRQKVESEQLFKNMKLLKDAASEYARSRKATIEMLRGLARDYKHLQLRKKIFKFVMLCMMVAVLIAGCLLAHASDYLLRESDSVSNARKLKFSSGFKLNDDYFTTPAPAEDMAGGGLAMVNICFLSITFVAVAVFIWICRRVTSKSTDKHSLLVKDMDASFDLLSALEDVKSTSVVMEEARVKIGGAGAVERAGTVLDSSFEEEVLQFPLSESSGQSVLESININEGSSVEADAGRLQPLFSVSQLPSDLHEQISSAVSANKIPAAEVEQFVNDFVEKIDCLSEHEMGLQIARITQSFGMEYRGL